MSTAIGYTVPGEVMENRPGKFSRMSKTFRLWCQEFLSGYQYDLWQQMKMSTDLQSPGSGKYDMTLSNVPPRVWKRRSAMLIILAQQAREKQRLTSNRSEST